MVRWGLDIGTNSIGWAIIDDEKKRIVDAGVRVFPEGVNELNTDKEVSKNAARRMFRQMRRQYARRRMRKLFLYKQLVRLGLAPEHDDDRAAFMAQDPYQLRARGLGERLELHQLGRVLYHLNQRRGFKSNRKVDSQDNEAGLVYSSISRIQDEMAESGSETLGQFFHNEIRRGNRVRGRYTARQMFRDEYVMVMRHQSTYYPELLTEEVIQNLGDGLMFCQRKLRSQKGLVGKCHLEPGKKRAPKSSLLFQEFRMWQQLNSLTVLGDSRVEEDEVGLSVEQMNMVAAEMLGIESLDLEKKMSTLVKWLNLVKSRKDSNFQANLRKINGNTSLAKLSKALGAEYVRGLSREVLEQMIHMLQFATDRERTIAESVARFSLPIDKAERFVDIFLEPGYGNLSTRAMKKVLPFMKAGYPYHEACEKAGYHHSASPSVAVTGEMPRIDVSKVRNPVVVVALNQVRRVVNELVQRYGQPNEIRVELGRELKVPLNQRLEIAKQGRVREAEAAEIRQILVDELGIPEPSRGDVIRYRLWREVGHTCPYSGKPISLKELFSGTVDVDHILPYSRTLDDSQSNKTICFREQNIEKGDRTPYEWRHNGRDESAYQAMLARVAQSSMPIGKKRRFSMTPETFAERNGDFIQRQLNDTRYISREAVGYLQYVCNKVGVANGSVTSLLRWQWGLDSLLSVDNQAKKNRSDHRHHAIDAICIAFTSQSLLQQMATLHSRQGATVRGNSRIEEPWNGFRSDVRHALDNVLVSHKVTRRVRGQFHEATYYGQVYERHTSIPIQSGKGKFVFVRRKKLDMMTDTIPVYKIADMAIRKLVIERLIECGLSAEKLKAEEKLSIPRNALSDLRLPSRRGVGPIINSVRVLVKASNMFQLRKNVNVWVEPGANHHYAIYENEDGTRKGEIVTLFEAYERMRAGTPLVKQHRTELGTFVCTLQRREMWLLDTEPVTPDELKYMSRSLLATRLHYVQKITDNIITLNRHVNTAEYQIVAGTKERMALNKTPSSLRGVKVVISPTGVLSLDNS